MKTGKQLAFFVLAIIFTLNTIAQKNSFIYTDGKKVKLPNGEAFIMRGTNLGNWLVPEGYMFKMSDVNSPRLINQAFTELIGPSATDSFWTKFIDSYITRADIHYMKSIGMNSIRVPFNYKLFTTDKYLGSSSAMHGFDLLDRVINWCKKEQLYVLLDLHCAPGGQTGDNIDDGDGYPFLFESANDQQLAADIWKRIAQRYANEPIVIGYDLLNEPIAHYFNKDHFNPRLEGVYKKITAAIRQVDKNHLIFLGGAQWDSNFDPFGKPFDSKLVYTFHKYWTAPTKEVIQPYIDFSNKYNVPIYCGETGENEDAWVDSFRVTLEANNIGWHFWPYKKMANKKGIMSFPVPTYFDSVIAYAEATKKNFADIRASRPKDMAAIKKAFDNFLEQCKFENCSPNIGYIKALAFDPDAGADRTTQKATSGVVGGEKIQGNKNKKLKEPLRQPSKIDAL